MSKKTKFIFNLDKLVTELEKEDMVDDDSEDYGMVYGPEEITPEDFGFILDSKGELKSVFMPETYDVIPDKVLKILELFGVTDPAEINELLGHVCH